MKEENCTRFIFSSTCATYGISEEIPIVETLAQNLIKPYGQFKLMLEKVLQGCESAWGLKSVFLRYFNATGSSSDGQIGEDHYPETHLIPLVIAALETLRLSLSPPPESKKFLAGKQRAQISAIF